MAINVVQRGELHTATDAASPTIASVALTVDRMYVLMSCASAASGDAPAIDSISATGITWTKRTTTGDSETWASRRVELWYGKCTSSGTVTVTVNYAATSTQGDIWIGEITGCKTTGTNGADMIVQAELVGTSSSAVASEIALAAFADSNNRPLGFYCHRANEATAHDSGAGYTELDDGNHASPSGGMSVQWHSSSPDETPSWSWSSSSQHGGIAIEIAAEAGGEMASNVTATGTVTGALKGSGELASNGTATGTVTGTLKGAGELASNATATGTLAGALKGAGELASGVTTVLTAAGTLKGAGELASSLTATSTLTGTLTGEAGSGDIEASVTATSDLAGTLKGSGELETNVTATGAVAGTLKGSGELASAGAATGAMSGTLKGSGELESAVTATGSVTGTLSGTEQPMPFKRRPGDTEPFLAQERAKKRGAFVAQVTMRRRRRQLVALGAQASPPVLEQVDKSKVVLQSDFLNIVEASSGTEIEITRDADGRMRFFLP